MSNCLLETVILAILFPVCLDVCAAGAARNVILCIGDGMGPEQVKAARLFKGEPLFFETLQHQGSMTVAPATGLITDSAASATAMATGVKVNNGVLSVAQPGDGDALPTCLEHFQGYGKSVGLVTTASITHATPSAFAVHATNRYDYAAIANDYLYGSRPNVLFGGGDNGMSPTGAVAAGYTVVTNRSELLAVESAEFVSGQFGAYSMPYEYDGLGSLPSLTDMTLAALRLLGNDPDGFFLMVEGGRIDHACHAHDIARCVAETLAFDAAVSAVHQWAAERNDTLLIVTADHETGGLSVIADRGEGVVADVTWSTGWHTATPVSVYTWGINAGLVTNVVTNADIYSLIMSPAKISEQLVFMSHQTPQELHIEWTASPGTLYVMESSPGLSGADWTSMGMITATSNRLHFVDHVEPRVGHRFYRLVTLYP